MTNSIDLSQTKQKVQELQTEVQRLKQSWRTENQQIKIADSAFLKK